MTMNAATQRQLDALSDYFAQNRKKILAEWRAAANADPAQTTVSALSRTQFNDHIPQLLTVFEEELKQDGRPPPARERTEEIKHGLQRWQQGYQLTELMHEWSHLHGCLAQIIAEFGRQNPGIESVVYHSAYKKLRRLIGNGVIESTGQYARMQQEEAAGNVNSLTTALAELRSVEKIRGELFRQTVHDLRGNVQSASVAAEILRDEGMNPHERGQFATSIQDGLSAVSTMLEDLMQLARLEAGLEKRNVVALDASELIRAFCATVAPFAQGKGLSLTADGPKRLPVDGDPHKLRRILQNLVGNALKYTEAGGVMVSWGAAGRSWWLSVKDSGPGMAGASAPPIVEGMRAATESAQESAHAGNSPIVIPSSVLPEAKTSHRKRPTKGGEGVGLSIVKRLCELLDASIELETSASAGTTFKVRLPTHFNP